MKPPILLKNILDILFILLIIGLLVYLSVAFYFSTNLSEDSSIMNVTVNGQNMHYPFNAMTYIVIWLTFLSKVIFIYTILKFRTLVSLFYHKEIFTSGQIKQTKWIGRLLIIIAVLDWVPITVYKLFFEKGLLRINFDTGGFDSFWFILALGFFFIYLSKVFDNARVLKEENDLTV